MTRAEEINVKIVYEIPDTRDPRLVRFRMCPPSLPSSRLHTRKLYVPYASPLSPAPFRSSLLFSNYSATMTSLNVARHSCEPVRAATPSRERRRLCTVQPGWRTFDPNILHAGCAKRSAGRLIEIEGGPPPPGFRVDLLLKPV